MYYTRDGSFQLDADGYLIAGGSGLKALGWPADLSTGTIDDTNSAAITPSSAIRIPVGQLAMARQTRNVSWGGNLDATTPVGGTYSTSAKVYDSLGVAHTLTVTFTKTANDAEWAWEASSPDAVGGGVVGSGTITFDERGQSSGVFGTISLDLANSNGAVNPMTIDLSVAPITQLSGASSVGATSQDGLALGVLQGFTIGRDGVINGRFDNGLTQKLGRLALANFSNPAGLSRLGNNLLMETSNSGLPQIGRPGTGSLGSITPGFLESSNVDLPTEFANMIVAQRGFQANSRIITTSDEILQELVQLKR